MNEERWHNFAKEKPSEDMEGRNFIVSNGHYEKIATWCGYWENEPFMGDHLCDEVVRWKFYFTPEEEAANTEYRIENEKLKAENERLKEGKNDYKQFYQDTFRELQATRRALWLARAERAADRARTFYFCNFETELDIDGFTYDCKKKEGHKKLTARLWGIIWLKVERLCRAKAQEYK